MDYVPSHGDAGRLADRDDTSGARVFDGEDQGTFLFYFLIMLLYTGLGKGLVI